MVNVILGNREIFIGDGRNTRKLKKEYNSAKYPLYCAFRKYGVENFNFKIIEKCSVKKLNEREIYYIDKYNSLTEKLGGFGYNLTVGGQLCETYVGTSDQGVYTYQYDLEGKHVLTHRNRREAAKSVGGNAACILKATKSGKPYKNFLWNNNYCEFIEPYKPISRSLRVLQYDMQGNFLKMYDSCKTASREIKCSDSLIQLCCSNACKTAKGYIFRYYTDDFPKIIDITPFIPETWNSVIQLNLNGEYVNEFLSSAIAERETGIPQGNIIACCNGNHKTAGGYIFKFKFNKKVKYNRKPRGKSIELLNDNGEIVFTFCSIIEATKTTGHSDMTIKKYCSNGKKLDDKYWRYKENLKRGEK